MIEVVEVVRLSKVIGSAVVGTVVVVVLVVLVEVDVVVVVVVDVVLMVVVVVDADVDNAVVQSLSIEISSI